MKQELEKYIEEEPIKLIPPFVLRDAFEAWAKATTPSKGVISALRRIDNWMLQYVELDMNDSVTIVIPTDVKYEDV